MFNRTPAHEIPDSPVKNEKMLAGRGFVSRTHRKKPQGKPMPECTDVANAQKSKARSQVEHVFARHKGLIGLANIAYKCVV